MLKVRSKQNIGIGSFKPRKSLGKQTHTFWDVFLGKIFPRNEQLTYSQAHIFPPLFYFCGLRVTLIQILPSQGRMLEFLILKCIAIDVCVNECVWRASETPVLLLTTRGESIITITLPSSSPPPPRPPRPQRVFLPQLTSHLCVLTRGGRSCMMHIEEEKRNESFFLRHFDCWKRTVNLRFYLW